jgi:hypothetical protein
MRAIPSATMSSNESPSDTETNNTGALRDRAPGSKNQTTRGTIKGFKAAVRAVTRRDPDAPKPQTRKRRSGGTEGRAPILRHRPRHYSERTARGRYEQLAPRGYELNEYATAGNLLCSAVQGIADIFADLNERLADVIYGRPGTYLNDPVDWLHLWDTSAGYDHSDYSVGFDTRSDHLSPGL